jgi:hypothetical protein
MKKNELKIKSYMLLFRKPNLAQVYENWRRILRENMFDSQKTTMELVLIHVRTFKVSSHSGYHM